MIQRYLTITLLTFLTCLYSMKAETVGNNTAPMFGIRAAVDVNIPGNWHNDNDSFKMFRHGCGFTVGGVYNVYMGRGFYFEPGVSFFYDSYSYDKVKITNSNGDLISNDPALHKFGLRIPVMAGYAFGVTDRLTLNVYTGPELSWAIGGKLSVKDKDFIDEFPDKLFGDFQRRIDCAWKIGVGVPYNEFLISIDAAIGITDILKNPAISCRENRVSVSLTYYF